MKDVDDIVEETIAQIKQMKNAEDGLRNLMDEGDEDLQNDNSQKDEDKEQNAEPVIKGTTHFLYRQLGCLAFSLSNSLATGQPQIELLLSKQVIFA